MKKLLLFILLSGTALSQTFFGNSPVIRDSISTIGNDSVWVDDVFSHIRNDTGRFHDLTMNALVVPQFQVWIRFFSSTSRNDTLRIQEKCTFGKNSTLDSMWITRMVYNPFISETPDSVVYVNRLPAGDTQPFTEVLLQTPFVSNIRIVRVNVGKATHKIHYEIWYRPWK